MPHTDALTGQTARSQPMPLGKPHLPTDLSEVLRVGSHRGFWGRCAAVAQPSFSIGYSRSAKAGIAYDSGTGDLSHRSTPRSRSRHPYSEKHTSIGVTAAWLGARPGAAL